MIGQKHNVSVVELVTLPVLLVSHALRVSAHSECVWSPGESIINILI